MAGHGSTACSRRASPRRRSSGGSSPPRSCTPTATGSTSRSRTGGSSGCAAGRLTGSTAGGSGPRTCSAGRRTASPDRLTRPLVREGGRLVEADWDDGDGPRRRALESSCSSARAAGGASASTPSGQLFLEEYYTLAVIGKAGLGTPHMDGNTRLCTATAAAALKASFGTDGQPGSYTDVDHCDAIALWGHNVAETQTVLWTRMLDRRRGAEPAAAALRRPARRRRWRARPTCTWRRGTGTNVALMNAHPARAHRARVDRRGLRRRAYARLRRARGDRRRLDPARACGRDLRRSRRATSSRRRRARRDGRAAALDGAAGLLPVAPGDGGGVPGEQPPPAARHARAPGRRASTR